MTEKTIRTGLVGAGYISSWHADTVRALPGVSLTAVCDASQEAADSLGSTYGVPAFGSLDAMLEARLCDVVHVLTPPQTHRALSIQALEAGCHVLVEKPMATSTEEAEAMRAAAEQHGRLLGVGHNFLGLPGYLRLREAVRSGRLGRISAAEFSWRAPLVPLRSGPYSLWMLRSSGNLLLELGPHLYAFAVDLFGTPEEFTLSLSKPIDLPGGGTRPQSWRILARAGNVDLTFTLSLVETMDDRSVTIHGSSGIGRLDFANDVLSLTQENTSEIVINPLRRQLSLSWQALREGLVNAGRQGRSLNRKSPYALSFGHTVESFYDAIRKDQPLDPRFSARSGVQVIAALEQTLERMPPQTESEAAPAPESRRKPQPDVLVIGGTGFIGRYLVRALVEAGHDVRVLSRGRSGPFDDIADRVELFSASLKSAGDLRRAMEGCTAVYHLAKTDGKTWEDYLENDVRVSERIAEAALAAGVARFVYTGTIASYDMSRPDVTITEKTGFGALEDRNLYARSKATCEALLEKMQRERGLPLIIARPGIVLGRGGPLQHWGIGHWNGAGAVRIWGDGRNILPFVLVEDVAEGLVRMLDPKLAPGQSFNLIGDPLMTAEDYFNAIAAATQARLIVQPGNLTARWLNGLVKYALKKHVLRKRNLERLSLRDWKSRAHYARFDNSHAKTTLAWKPEADRARFVQRAITEANLFGF